ncbi:MAG: putative acetyltransferase, partial [Actinomycetia bacterium]|nr:putative acetyltransferase [Actinomycetes bacterium]
PSAHAKERHGYRPTGQSERVLQPVVLEGAIVRLEPLTLAHVDGLAAAASEDRSTYALTAVPDGPAATAAYVAQALAEQAADAVLPFATCSAATGAVVGSTRFLDLAWWDGPHPSVAEIGSTWLAASVQRTAVNTESKLLLLAHAFETWGSLRVSLKTDARNARSRAAIERIGGRFEGVRRVHMPAADGGIRDSAYYSITAAEWPDVKAALQQRLSASPTP